MADHPCYRPATYNRSLCQTTKLSSQDTFFSSRTCTTVSTLELTHAPHSSFATYDPSCVLPCNTCFQTLYHTPYQWVPSCALYHRLVALPAGAFFSSAATSLQRFCAHRHDHKPPAPHLVFRPRKLVYHRTTCGLAKLVLSDFLELFFDFSDGVCGSLSVSLRLQLLRGNKDLSCDAIRLFSLLSLFRFVFFFYTFKAIYAACSADVEMPGLNFNDTELVRGDEICIISRVMSFCSNAFSRPAYSNILSRFF